MDSLGLALIIAIFSLFSWAKACARYTVQLGIFLFCIINTSSAGTLLSIQAVENWIDSQQALEQWGRKHHQEISNYEQQPDASSNPMEMTVEEMLRPLKDSGLYPAAQAVVEKHGFDSLEQWAQTSLKITKTASAIEIEKHPTAFDTSELQALINSPQISKPQKILMSQAMERNLAIMEQLKREVSDADKNIVRPFLDRIDQLMKSEY